MFELNEKDIMPWERLLRVFFKLPQDISFLHSNEKEFYEHLSSMIKNSVLQIELGLDFLQKNGLIKIIPIKHKEKINFRVILEPKGFEVALNNEKHERELKQPKRQENINLNLLNVTIITALSSSLLAFVTLFNFLYDLSNSPSWSRGGSLAIAGILIVLTTAILVTYLINFIVSGIKQSNKKE